MFDQFVSAGAFGTDGATANAFELKQRLIECKYGMILIEMIQWTALVSRLQAQKVLLYHLKRVIFPIKLTFSTEPISLLC